VQPLKNPPVQNKLSFEIYRKRTTTVLILCKASCHPYEHRKGAINYLYNRMEQYKITKENEKEGTINQILKNNEYYTPSRKQRKQQQNLTLN
jgi:hypothetical protein